MTRQNTQPFAILADEDADRALTLAMDRKQAEKQHRIHTALKQFFYMGVAITASLGLASEFVDEKHVDTARNAAVVTIGLGLLCGCNIISTFGDPTPEECDLSMYELGLENPGAFEGPMHKYPGTPARWQAKQAQNEKKLLAPK